MPDRPVVITDARLSADDELRIRKRRYLITMLTRIPLLIGGGILASMHLPVLAVIMVVLSVPLPWVAVLIANDSLARDSKALKPVPGQISYERAIENTHHVIDVEDDAAR